MSMINLRRFAVLVRRAFLTLYSVEGEYDGSPMRLLLADDNDTLHYIKGLVFPDGASITRKGRISSFSAHRLMNSDADMVVIGANQLLASRYASKGFYVVPKFVRQILLVDDPDRLVAGLGRKTRATVRQALAMWPNWEIAEGLEAFEEFYYRMYRPYAASRFGEDVGICSYERVKRDMERGYLVMLKTDGKPVFGGIMFKQGSTLRLAYSGVMEGQEEVARHGGAMTALFYHSLQFAYSSGCRDINLGHSRPFLSDGVLRFKMKWGSQTLEDDDGVASFAIAAPGNTTQAMKFFAANPFFYLQQGKLRVYEGSPVQSVVSEHREVDAGGEGE